MKKRYFNPACSDQPIITGYIGAIIVIVFVFVISFLELRHFNQFNLVLDTESSLLIMIFIASFFMSITNCIVWKGESIKNKIRRNKKTTLHLIISTLYRFSVLLIVFYLMFFIINRHPYFSDTAFQITRKFSYIFLIVYFIFGIPYIFLTLKYKGFLKYEFNDYSTILMLIVRGVLYFIAGKLINKELYFKKAKRILLNKRVRKVILTYIVIFFFSTLMTKFLGNEFREFSKAMNTVLDLNKNSTFFDKYSAYYWLLYHLLYFVDVSLALIGYTFVSRWLDNRTRSVDMTLGGWLVAIMCYPPMNSGFTAQFINYNNPNLNPIVTSEIGNIIVMTFTLLLITIYVWSTVALSFKFSNLTNRGIVTTGPYSIVRHPAYIAKNLSWWLESNYVLSNFWAAAALLAWNAIYILRGLTEERHLIKDPRYKLYCKKVKYRFIPGLF